MTNQILLIYAGVSLILFQFFCIYFRSSEKIEHQIFEITHELVEDLNLNISQIINHNNKISEKLEELRQRIFFKLFRVNFNSKCSIFSQNAICRYEACQVCQCEDHEIPLPWKQETINDQLNKKVEEKFSKLIEKYNYSTNDWLVENEIDAKNGIYVDLLKNPEGYTGYQGQQIWTAIYKENCFSGILENMCNEEKIFFKIISGIHSNVNLHVSRNYLNIDSNSTYSNYELMRKTFLDHKDRINNLFYLNSLLLHAFFKAENIITNFQKNTGYTEDDVETLKIIKTLYNNKEILNFYKQGYENSKNIKKFFKYERLNEIKMKFRNISEIINCVSCQKCRLHGKLQIYGVATMLKILFTEPGKLNIKRNEMVSLVNMIGKVCNNIKFVSDYLYDNKGINEIKKRYFLSFEILIILFSLFSLIVIFNCKRFVK